ncbi:DUF1853 family protein [Halomonas sp. 707D4]|uniref:DUF1853 family protein n=1 Tax=Halomonas sp. 707D4 TaxID=1904455 RepID=UPI0020A1CDC6|nr:DUF1853 family protein [Halomonas sp. 707D4]MCP1328053.1 DUF1853 family protein [Halomonas sp. 707D4]
MRTDAIAEPPAAPPETAIAHDLAWLLDAPDIVALDGYEGRPSRAELGLAPTPPGWNERRAKAARTLAGKLPTRLGHYHEALWRLLLDSAPATRLLAHNVAIRQQRRTLGELDLVYRTLADPAPIHLEVAIKFYLGLPEGPGALEGQDRWIGPGGLDSLARKCAHLVAHQLPLSATPLARDTLRRLLAPRDGAGDEGLEGLTRRLAMPGVLFYPFHAPLPPPTGASAHHARGLWCHASDWETVLKERMPARLAWLKKPFWLAPPRDDAFLAPSRLLPALTEALERFGPQQVMLRAEGGWDGKEERVFIVPDDWPRQVPLPLPGR